MNVIAIILLVLSCLHLVVGGGMYLFADYCPNEKKGKIIYIIGGCLGITAMFIKMIAG